MGPFPPTSPPEAANLGPQATTCPAARLVGSSLDPSRRGSRGFVMQQTAGLATTALCATVLLALPTDLVHHLRAKKPGGTPKSDGSAARAGCVRAPAAACAATVSRVSAASRRLADLEAPGVL